MSLSTRSMLLTLALLAGTGHAAADVASDPATHYPLTMPRMQALYRAQLNLIKASTAHPELGDSLGTDPTRPCPECARDGAPCLCASPSSPGQIRTGSVTHPGGHESLELLQLGRLQMGKPAELCEVGARCERLQQPPGGARPRRDQRGGRGVPCFGGALAQPRREDILFGREVANQS